MEFHLPSPPFIKVDGMHNFRDFGGYPIATRPGRIVRSSMLYRSANPSTITDDGIRRLQELNITRVFDLRSDREIEESTKFGWGKIRTWEPAVRISASIFPDELHTKEHRARRDHNLKNRGDEGYVAYYCETLASTTSASNPAQPLKMILSYLAAASPSGPGPILIHCSLGKDRTGVICALILSLCGVEDTIIAHEYALTALGIAQKVKEIILEIRPNGPGKSEEEDRFFGSKKEAMQGFLEWIKRNGGIEKYLTETGIISSSQIQQLRKNLTVAVPAVGESVE